MFKQQKRCIDSILQNKVSSNLADLHANHIKTYNRECRRTSLRIAEKDGANITLIVKSIHGDNNTAYKVFEELQAKYNSKFQRILIEASWQQVMGELK